MPWDLSDCRFSGPALPDPFVKTDLEKELKSRDLLPVLAGKEGKRTEEGWNLVQAKVRKLVSHGGALRVKNHVIDPLLPLLGYGEIEEAGEVSTREGMENGGFLLLGPNDSKLRVWCIDLDGDLDTPSKRGHAYRFSHTQIARRVLNATNERLGILTNGFEIRLILSDPARSDSQVIIDIDPHWKKAKSIPSSFLFLIALARPEGIAKLPEIIEKARLQQVKVTKELRTQARQAVEGFIQEILDHPENKTKLEAFTDKDALAKQLWREGLITVYRLLFILKLESTDDPARTFSFASNSLWRGTFSPTLALAPLVRTAIDHGITTGSMLEHGLRRLFSLFADGLSCTEINVRPMGGALFSKESTPLTSELKWGENAVAKLLDNLLWTSPKRGSEARERVHYGPLDVEDLGRVYESLLELEAGIAQETMCKLRRGKLEVVVPSRQGEVYQTSSRKADDSESEDNSEAEENEEDQENVKGGKVEWIEEINTGAFYLRAGLGRKSTGSFYTPHSFVRFLVKESLSHLIERASPITDPNPCAILEIKSIDTAMGSGHFLAEACRFIGEKIYEAVRRCDEEATLLEEKAEKTEAPSKREELLSRVQSLRKRIVDLPDPDDELLRYLPSRSTEGQESGLSQSKAKALCRRLAATHCLYGVDKNPLAVELARLALWIECHAEGLPLTFLDHRLVTGDALTGPFFENLLSYPISQTPISDIFDQGLADRLSNVLSNALKFIEDIEASVGVSLAELELKAAAKSKLDALIGPFRILAAAWSGGVMLGSSSGRDQAYLALLTRVAEGCLLSELRTLNEPELTTMVSVGLGLPAESNWDECINQVAAPSSHYAAALPFDLTFPEVFYRSGNPSVRTGFDATLGNPPWDKMLPADKEFFASFDFGILNAKTKKVRLEIQKQLLTNPRTERLYSEYLASFRGPEAVLERLYRYQIAQIGGERTIGKQDAFRAFMERNHEILAPTGVTGVVVPAAFHANEGATGIRHLYLKNMRLVSCFSFENRKKLFEIDSRFKFATVVAQKGKQTNKFDCAFYLHDDEWLFTPNRLQLLSYDLNFVARTGGDYMSLLEVHQQEDLSVAEVCFQNGEPFDAVCKARSIEYRRELNITDDAWRFIEAGDILPKGADSRDPSVTADLRRRGFLVLHEGKTFHQFNDLWEDRPQYVVPMERLADKPRFIRNACFFKLAYRGISASTNERTAIFSLHPPSVITQNQNPCEIDPGGRPNAKALEILGIANSFPFDFCLRLFVSSSTVNYFFLARAPMPKDVINAAFISHSALRLVSNHAGYKVLWDEQLGGEWREDSKAYTWPVLRGEASRWALASAVDAVVAHSYRLTRAQYAHILDSFSHATFPRSKDICLKAFDELSDIGLEAFCRRHDPYWDIPLNPTLPKPAITIEVPTEQQHSQFSLNLDVEVSDSRPRKGKRSHKR